MDTTQQTKETVQSLGALGTESRDPALKDLDAMNFTKKEKTQIWEEIDARATLVKHGQKLKSKSQRQTEKEEASYCSPERSKWFD